MLTVTEALKQRISVREFLHAGGMGDAAAVNSLRSDRVPVEEFASLRGFSDPPQ